MLGVIDRLVVAPGKVLAADFKSNRLVPASPEAVPEGLLRQMGAYRAALAQVFPGREIATALVFTQTAARIDLPARLTMPALERALAMPGAPAPG
jgi:ATP-dependent helicase/nuclease subunit A